MSYSYWLHVGISINAEPGLLCVSKIKIHRPVHKIKENKKLWIFKKYFLLTRFQHKNVFSLYKLLRLYLPMFLNISLYIHLVHPLSYYHLRGKVMPKWCLEYCGFVWQTNNFFDNCVLNNWSSTKHKIQTFSVCEYCGCVFENKWYLKYSIDAINATCQCTCCDKTFVWTSRIKRHNSILQCKN